jgi:hypothetical protein
MLQSTGMVHLLIGDWGGSQNPVHLLSLFLLLVLVLLQLLRDARSNLCQSLDYLLVLG